MIIFSTVVNNGGMVRIAEWCARTELEKIDEKEILFIVFCPEPIPTTKKNIIFIEWTQTGSSYNELSIRKYQNELRNILAPYTLEAIIGDYQTLCYYDIPGVPIVYDVHVLGRSLYNSVSKCKGLQRLDENFLTIPMATVIDMSSFNFLKFEHRFIKAASALLVNSQNSNDYLLKDYADEVLGKPIQYIPLPFVQSEKDIQPYSQRNFLYSVYTFGRLHPQKGHCLLFEKNWEDCPLVIRGIDSSSIKRDGLLKLQKQSITLLDWSNEPDIIQKDLLQSRVVIFPSIHEPWGLALQEAMNLGCICVANSAGEGHKEQIENGQNGYLLDMSSEGWVEELIRIMNFPMAVLQSVSEKAQASSASVGGDKRREESLKKFVKRDFKRKIDFQ